MEEKEVFELPDRVIKSILVTSAGLLVAVTVFSFVIALSGGIVLDDGQVVSASHPVVVLVLSALVLASGIAVWAVHDAICCIDKAPSAH